MSREQIFLKAKSKDIKAFNEVFSALERPLKSYLYRLLTNREDVEDFYHNTFIKAFDKIDTFKGEQVQFKSWVFTIATRLAYNHLGKQKKWLPQAQDICRDSLVDNPEYQKAFMTKVVHSTYNKYEITEHIDFCFTCINKTMPIDQQVALLLKDIMGFKVSEVAQIMSKTKGQVKHYLVDARKTMSELFGGRCALINKKGTCHQCSELQGIFNPQIDTHRKLIKIPLTQEAKNKSKSQLFKLRAMIVKSIHPMYNDGSDLHDHLMQHMKKVNDLK